MGRWHETGGGGVRRSRSAGVMPLVAAVTSALALTGAAFYTVDRAACGDPGQYVRQNNRIELVGGCVGDDLSGLQTISPRLSTQNAEYNNYRP